MKAILLPQSDTESTPIEIAKFLVAEATEQLKSDTSEKPEIVTAMHRLEESVYWIGKASPAVEGSAESETVQTEASGANPGTSTAAAGPMR